MIKINCPDIEEIKKEYVDKIWLVIKKKRNIKSCLNNTDFVKKCTEIYSLPLEDITKEKHDEYKSYFENLCETILGEEKVDVKKAKKVEEEVEKIKTLFFNYTAIMNHSSNIAYWLTQKLGVSVCPYCNRQYIFTVYSKNGKKIARPQLDHFLNKNEFPFFALSFYNLIPSCSICNHIKGTQSIFLHPYKEDFDTWKFNIDKVHNCFFGKKTLDNPNEQDWEIIFNFICTNSNKIKTCEKCFRIVQNINVFALKEIYAFHKDYVSELVFKAQAYTETYYDSVIKSFSDLGLNEAEIHRQIFGTYVLREDFDKRPLAKLTHDILEQLGVK